MALLLQLKDTDWLIGLKEKIQLFVVHKRNTSLANIYAQAESKRMENNIPSKEKLKANRNS
jgi:hypothetical protein